MRCPPKTAVVLVYRFSNPNCSFGRKNAEAHTKELIFAFEDDPSLFKSEHS